MMTELEASQVAELLNKRNQLAKQYSAAEILECNANYVLISENDIVVACAEVKKVQWYQWEISHVCVHIDFAGRGFGGRILKDAETKAITGNAKILQCTIRSSNKESIGLFTSRGYNQTSSFFYHITGNWVHVLQKSVSVDI